MSLGGIRQLLRALPEQSHSLSSAMFMNCGQTALIRAGKPSISGFLETSFCPGALFAYVTARSRSANRYHRAVYLCVHAIDTEAFPAARESVINYRIERR